LQTQAKGTFTHTYAGVEAGIIQPWTAAAAAEDKEEENEEEKKKKKKKAR
jgi:hypothetical protein